MKSELRISLVGWGHEQVIFHAKCNQVGVSIWNKGRLQQFALTPWLSGRILVMPSRGYDHSRVKVDNHDTAIKMRNEAVKSAIEAIMERDIFYLAECVTTTYMAQQLLGGTLLKNLGEIGKRYCGDLGAYLFKDPGMISEKLRKNSVLVA